MKKGIVLVLSAMLLLAGTLALAETEITVNSTGETRISADVSITFSAKQEGESF